MSGIFQEVKDGLRARLPDVVQNLLPGGRISGREYYCGSLQGGQGDSCRTNLETGVGSDFATGDSWRDVIDLAAKVWNTRPYEAAEELDKQYGIGAARSFRPVSTSSAVQSASVPVTFTPILPAPDSAPEPPRRHPQHGQCGEMWRYQDTQGRALAYAVRFDLPDGKAVLPLCYGQYGNSRPQWHWKALPEPRPLYGLPKLAAMPEAPVLLVEGEKTADAAQVWFPHYAALTWSGGGKAVSRADFSPLQGREIIIWPDNDEPGFAAALELAKVLEDKARSLVIVQPPDTLPPSWDLADQTNESFHPQVHIETAMPVAEFANKAAKRFSALGPSIAASDTPPDLEDITIKEWPVFSFDACPGILGEFVKLATRDSEADPAAIAITALVRFCAEVYGHTPDKGPHIYVGETVHPPRLFAVICGNSSKARKGTSRHPVTKLFGREYCSLVDLREWGLPLPSRESGGPLSTGEGLAHHVRDESDEEREPESACAVGEYPQVPGRGHRRARRPG